MEVIIKKIVRDLNTNKIFVVFDTYEGERKTLITQSILNYHRVKTVKKGDILEVSMSFKCSKNNPKKRIQLYKIIKITNV